MSEQTNSGIDLGVSTPSIEDRMQAFVNAEVPAEDEPAPPPQETAAEPPQDQEPTEPTADDLPDEPVVQSAEEAWEIVHDGKSVKLTREEVIRNAQQGFDYTQKTQEVAKRRAEVDVILQRASQVEQMVPQLVHDVAQVKAFESQLQNYQNVDWIALATNDPLEYPKYRAQYDQLMQGHQQATYNLNQRADALAREKQQLTAYTLQQERAALVEKIPEWRDPDKYQAGAQELAGYLTREGASSQDLSMLTSAVAVNIARKAMLYDKLKLAKTEKAKQLRPLPPVSKPGAPSVSVMADKERDARAKLKKTGSRDDAVGLLLSRM